MPAKFWRKRQIMSKSDGVHEEGDVCALCGGLVFDPVIPQPKREPLTDAPLYLSNLVTALDNAFISSWQSTHHWKKQLDEARDYLAAHGIKENT